jgi:glutamine cyclotransferase
LKFNNRLLFLIFSVILLTLLFGCSSKEVQVTSVTYSQPRVIAEYPHDSNAFTQGLEFSGERLFESTGLFGKSSIREVNLQSGSTHNFAMLNKNLFGEGLTFLDENRILQLTWKSGKALIWKLDPLKIIGDWEYEGQGWGVCLLDDGRLAMSNGSDSLSFRNPETFEVIDSIRVTLDGAKVEKLNELECDNQTIWANIWQTDRIVGIDFSTGSVTHVLETSNLPLDRENLESGAVLNGIARIPGSKNFLITGKLWPKIFEVSFTSN